MNRTAIGLILFGVSFGYVEAAVVVYLRAIYEPLRAQLLGGTASSDILPLIPWEQLRTEAPSAANLVGVELVREAATILMLAGAALLSATTRMHWLASFAVAFGTWDLSFYLTLKALLDWPKSLMDWDLLFLIPVPWVAPVLAPVLVSIALVACGLAALSGRITIRPTHWLGLGVGGALVLLSFTIDYSSTLIGEMPRPFVWPLFFTGEVLALAAFAHARFGPQRPT